MDKPIGIFGGTFDPIHFGHLHLVKEVYPKLHLKEVRFIPTFLPVHRNVPNANAKNRLQMVKLATANQAGMLVDDREIRRQGPSYMIDTLKSLHQEIPKNPLYLIMAVDAFMGFNTWHQWQKILNYAHIIVVNRPGTCLSLNPELKQLLQNHQIKNSELLTTKSQGYIYFIDVSPLNISGTQIRQQIAAGISPKKFLPSPVWEYIKEHKLYNYQEKNN